jgi:hypothetical protein
MIPPQDVAHTLPVFTTDAVSMWKRTNCLIELASGRIAPLINSKLYLELQLKLKKMLKNIKNGSGAMHALASFPIGPNG